jgi:hypothetical protein
MYLHPAASRTHEIQAPHGEETGRRVDDGPGSRKSATFKPTNFTGFFIAAVILCCLPIRDHDQHRPLAETEMTASTRLRTIGNPSLSPTRPMARADRVRKQNAARRTVRSLPTDGAKRALAKTSRPELTEIRTPRGER